MSPADPPAGRFELTRGSRTSPALGLVVLGLVAASVMVSTAPASSLLAPAILAVALGTGLNGLFRSDAGPGIRSWRRIRAARDPQLFRGYAVAGPWLWRSGSGALVGLALRALTGL